MIKKFHNPTENYDSPCAATFPDFPLALYTFSLTTRCRCANTLELRLSCINPSVYYESFVYVPTLILWTKMRNQSSGRLLQHNQSQQNIVRKEVDPLTLKSQETHGCVFITVATDVLVLKHQATISATLINHSLYWTSFIWKNYAYGEQH